MKLPPPILDILHARHGDQLPAPINMFGPTSMNFLPVNTPLIQPLLNMDLTPQVATGHLQFIVEKDFTLLAFPQGDGWLFTQPLPLQELAEMLTGIHHAMQLLAHPIEDDEDEDEEDLFD